MLTSFSWATLGHLIGCLLYAFLYGMTITRMGTDMSHPLVQNLIGVSEAKTIGYRALGSDGLILVTVKAILCNWMVTLGVVLAFTSKSTGGKIAAMWLPILTFFAQGFEHAVVNMFVIPAGMLLGAEVTLTDWWLWNQIPVLIGNFIGGAFFTGFLLYWTHRMKNIGSEPSSQTKKTELQKAASVKGNSL
ncbi:putative formate transporter 1 [compost metagenome]